MTKRSGKSVYCKKNLNIFYRKADDNTFDEFEKENYDHFIYISQFLRGTMKGLSDYNNKIK